MCVSCASWCGARHKLVGDRTRYKNQIHAVLAKHCLMAPVTDAFGPGGRVWLDTICLEGAYKYRVEGTLDLVDHLDAQITGYDKTIAQIVKRDPAYGALTSIPRVGAGVGCGVHCRDRRHRSVR